MPGDAVLADAAACIADGGTLIFPTETVYGIGCAPDDAAAVDAIFRAKRRSADKPLAIHLARPEQAMAFAALLRPSARRIMQRLWPGPIAIVVERAPGVATAAALNGDTISLRCPDDDACRAILRATGPLAATSANISDAPPFTGEQADESALPGATLAIITGPTRLRQESTVVDCTGDKARILRRGAVDEATIASV
ncbi:MAG: threonylcarbamoyl-AMP synthase [Candidatus Eremiobacteraeota bacterium]|nr:threonylcarbamoyl-AMP synthase [Candidatus Eremiobacteraeota bacterium]